MSSPRATRKSERHRDRPLALSGSGATVRDRVTPPRKRKAAPRRAVKQTVPTFERQSTSDVYKGLISEAAQPAEEVRPLKRRKTAAVRAETPMRSMSVESAHSVTPIKKNQQTTFDDSDSAGGSDVDWEDIDLQKENDGENPSDPVEDDPPGDISVVIGREPAKPTKTQLSRRLPSSAIDKKKRLDVHKIHVCCLLAHVYTRNAWCNDEAVQTRLRPLLGNRVESYLNPDPQMSQFQRSRSFMDGLQQASDLWSAAFKITMRGLRRPLWAASPEDLAVHNQAGSAEASTIYHDFLLQATKRHGSRDLGAQLFCALLRSAGVEARLVCSLQPLPFAAVHLASTPKKTKPSSLYGFDSDTVHETADEGTASDTSIRSIQGIPGINTPTSGAPKRIKRFGQTGSAVAIHDLGVAPSIPVIAKRKKIRESSYPVFWVEAFNSAVQKWLPVDPLVTNTIAKNSKFEPPAADSANDMSYVVAFADDGTVRDVTIRYTKAYNAKTRKARVESTKGGQQWWRKTMRIYKRKYKEDQDQVEDAEFARLLASEPMPQNVLDFKDHPYYALDRHLRHNEVIEPRREVGKVRTGKSADSLEPIYRRQDVHIVKTADKWYRLGREIKTDEQALKYAKKRRTRARSLSVDGPEANMDDEDEGNALYAGYQTQMYIPPPVTRGRIPKNVFGNLDLYVSSMIPPGGVHVRAAEAAKAARLVGVDYADAVTGFQFKGRHGTAVMNGAVVAAEFSQAVEEAIRAMRYDRERVAAAKQSKEALRLWKRFLTGLKIRERIMDYEEEGGKDGVREQIDRAEDEEAMTRAEGGFVPGVYEEEDHRNLPAKGKKAVRLDSEAPEEELDAPRDTEELLPSIASPWDLPRNSRFHPQPDLTADEVLPGGRAAKGNPGHLPQNDEEGGFIRADEAGGEGGFSRDEQPRDDSGGGFIVEHPRAEPSCDNSGGGFIPDEEPGGFFKEEAPMQILAPVQRHMRNREATSIGAKTSRSNIVSSTNNADTDKIAPQNRTSVASSGGGTLTTKNKSTSTKDLVGPASRAPPSDLPMRIEEDTDGPTSTRPNSFAGSSPAGSLFSHDPDDDEAEPDWLVEDLGL